MNESPQATAVHAIFAKANFVQALGITVTALGEGRCETRMPVLPMHQQQDGFVHAGALTTLADHTAGGAALMCMAEGEAVLSIELKMNMLSPALGPALRCVGTVLRAGRTVVVAEAEVFAQQDGAEKRVGKATVTLIRQRRA